MVNDKTVASAIDKGVYIIHTDEDFKTCRPPELSYNVDQEKNQTDNVKKNNKEWFSTLTRTIAHFALLLIIGLMVWGMLWFAWGEGWRWDGQWFRLAAVVVAAWLSGQVLEATTTLPPLLAALIIGILARNLGYVDMRDFTHIDMFLRKIYPVIILGKGSLAWNTNFMKTNWRQVVALGAAPWTAEVVTLAACMHYLFGHPWIWGFLLGTFYASVSCPVIMPAVLRVGSNPRRTRNWPQIVCTAGGIDTALSVGVFGVVSSFMFNDVDVTHRYIRAILTLFVGVALGVTWGTIAGHIPNSQDCATELRILFVLVGGLFLNFFTMYVGWGGVAGVAVLACNATAARYWAKTEWKLNNNPASTAYRVMWATCEPALFTYTGTFFVIDSSMSETLLVGFAILLMCLIVRLSVTAVMCWGMTLRERLFICCCWSIKSIVEAVLSPIAIVTLAMNGALPEERKYAEDILRLTVQAILVTTPVGFLLTNNIGPILLKDKQPSCDARS